MNKKSLLPVVLLSLALSANGAFAFSFGNSSKEEVPPPPPEVMGEMQPPPPEFGRGQNQGKFSLFNKSPKCVEQMRKEHEKRKAEFDKRLNLTDEQKALVEKNRQEARAKMKPIYDAMKVKKDKIVEVKKSSLSQIEKSKQVKELKIQIKTLRNKAHKLRKENMVEFEKLLTPEQKTEFAKIRCEHQQKMKKKFEKFKKYQKQGNGYFYNEK